MMITEIFKKYNEDEIIELIKKNKLNVSLEELLISSVALGNNKLSNYLINEDVSFEYKDKLDYNCYLMAVNCGNIDIIKSLLSKGLNLYKKYNIYGNETYAISEINNLKTFKFFEENNIPKEVFEKCIENIVCNTICTHNLELLSYLIENYKIDITKYVYKTPDKNYSILDKTKELLKNMKKMKTRKKNYEEIKELEKEIKELNDYYEYLREIFKNVKK